MAWNALNAIRSLTGQATRAVINVIAPDPEFMGLPRVPRDRPVARRTVRSGENMDLDIMQEPIDEDTWLLWHQLARTWSRGPDALPVEIVLRIFQYCDFTIPGPDLEIIQQPDQIMVHVKSMGNLACERLVRCVLPSRLPASIRLLTCGHDQGWATGGDNTSYSWYDIGLTAPAPQQEGDLTMPDTSSQIDNVDRSPTSVPNVDVDSVLSDHRRAIFSHHNVRANRHMHKLAGPWRSAQDLCDAYDAAQGNVSNAAASSTAMPMWRSGNYIDVYACVQYRGLSFAVTS